MLNEERIKQLSEQVPAVVLDKPLLKMSVGEFVQALDEKYALSIINGEEYAFMAFGKYKQYMQELQAITNYIKKYEVETEGDEKAAMQGVEFPSLQERILLDCVRFYHLHSTEESETLPITDWLIVVKSEGAAAQYQRNLSKIQQRRQQTHGK